MFPLLPFLLLIRTQFNRLNGEPKSRSNGLTYLQDNLWCIGER